MSTNQELRHISVRTVTGTTGTYLEDWMALFDTDGIAAGTFNERFLLWLEGKSGITGLTLNEQMTLFALSEGVFNWDALGTFDASGGGGGADIRVTSGGDTRVTSGGDRRVTSQSS